jgi:hypothetical protein
MYYGTSLDMEIKATLACNRAVEAADPVIASGADTTPPTVWLPQRLPWNPGGRGGGSLWGYPGGAGAVMSQDFYVWTFVYDVSGIASVELKYRPDDDGVNTMTDDTNETYVGGPGVGPWQSVPMTFRDFPAGNFHSDPGIDFTVMPDYIADEYYAHMTGFEDVLLDYYVEATDSLGHVKRSPIQHVWVGSGGGAPPDTCVWWDPPEPEAGATVAVYYDLGCRTVLPQTTDPVYIHIGHSEWQDVIQPDPAMVWDAVEEAWRYTYAIPAYATSVEFVFNDGAGNWDNNSGSDWSVAVTGGSGGPGYDMDGAVDAEASLVASGTSLDLYVDFAGSWLYVATQGVGVTSGIDHFILIDDDPSGSRSAPWAKAGTVAGWDYLLGNEDTNGWSGWFDTGENPISFASTLTASGAYLEGALDLGALYGSVPESIHIAVGGYASPDGGALSDQAPPGDGDGNIERVEYYAMGLSQTGTESGEICGPPVLHAVSPNPAAAGSVVRFFLPAEADISLDAYDVRGRLVAALAEGLTAAGSHEAVWSGRDRYGRALPSGVYFLRLASPEGAAVEKVVFLR